MNEPNSKRGRPPVRPQPAARAEIAKALKNSPVSLRALAARAGLKSHAAVSRFLAGRQTLSGEVVLKIAAVLGIEGRSLDRVLGDVVPAAALRHTREVARSEPTAGDDEERSRVRLMKFFFHPRTALIYEVLKVLGSPDQAAIRRALHPRWCPTGPELTQCLRMLTELGLVTEDAGHFRVVDARQDIVIPAKHSTDVGRRVLADALATHGAFLQHETGKQVLFMRSVLSSLRLPASGKAIDALAPLLLRLRDDVLALQGDEDDAVVHLLLSAVEVGAAPR